MPPRRRRRIWKILLGILAVLLIGLIYAAWPGSSTFTVSPETTYVTEPLDKHGYVDYVTALNERLRGNIKPEENANVLIWQAEGPHPEGGNSGMPDEYFQWLGIARPPEEGEYLLGFSKYLTEHVKDDTYGHQKHEELQNRMVNAGKRPWTEKEEPELADWLKKNEKPLGLMIEATRRPAYYNPEIPRRDAEGSREALIGALLPSVQKCRETAAALTARAMLRASNGQFDDAWQDLLACHRLGRLLARGGTVIEMLVGLAIEQIAQRADLAWLGNAKPTSKELQQHWLEYVSLPAMAEVADKIDLGERFMGLDAMMHVARYGRDALEGLADGKKPTHRGRFQDRLFTQSINWDPGLRNANRWYDRAVAAARITDREEREYEMAAIEADLRTLKQQVAADYAKAVIMGPKSRGEVTGNLLICLMFPAIIKLRNATDRYEQNKQNLHLAFALAAYRADKRRYPETLAELAPKYIDKIPDDLFSGQPLIYRLEGDGYLLYSVGVNGIDDGGQGYDDDPKGDDLVIRMPVPEPKLKK